MGEPWDAFVFFLILVLIVHNLSVKIIVAEMESVLNKKGLKIIKVIVYVIRDLMVMIVEIGFLIGEINDILIFSNLIIKLLKKENYKKIKKIFKSYKIENKYLEIILKIDKTLDKILLSQKMKKIILKNLI